jgi:four helix bundle protein
MTLVAEIYKISKGFPKDEACGLTSQMRRCANSIPSNMAEEMGEIRLMSIFISYELQTQMEISMNLCYLNRDEFDKLLN